MTLVSPRFDKWIWFFMFLLMSLYVLYEHATSCLAITHAVQIERHKNIMAGTSEFYNPWQYRILSPYILEGFIQFFNKILPGKFEMLPYLFFKFIQNMLIFYISFYYYKALQIRNPILIFAGLMLLCYTISNSVFQSDFSFNTYFDIIFYLLAACVILHKKYYWILPITFFAAVNRETSGFIPLMVVAPFLLFDRSMLTKDKWIITLSSLAVFAAVFVSIRLYFGFREAEGIHGMRSPLAYLKFNLTFFRMYPQLFGTLGLIPLITLFGFRRLPLMLKSWCLLIVPFWFVIHLAKSTAMESRLFLVPQALIFIPAMLWLIEDYYRNHSAGEPLRKV
ncbi:hypothetical protein [Ohtaekwangia sp.]|uniref:hypothetical protein n=1 Tax=Ohtaekwangia sp. TaxID=2066019 RepID=UPI002F9363CD